MERLPMGLSIAPELLHSVCATLCAAPLFASPQLVVPRVRVDVFVDNGRWSGAPRDVRRAVEAADRRVAAAGGTWKQADSVDLAADYVFLGVAYSHSRRTVAVAAKSREKIIAALHCRRLRLDELEALAGRLCWAAAVSGEHLAAHYFVLKWIRRRLNHLARGLLRGDAVVLVPRGVRRRLHNLAEACLARRVVRVPTDATPEYTLITDASTSGMGVIELADGCLRRCWGRPWAVHERQAHINALEAQALLEGLVALPAAVSNCRLNIFVDNTSVVGAARKGSSPAATMAGLVAQISSVIRRRGLLAEFAYVPTSVNPADLPSRDSAVRDGVVERAVAAFVDWRSGGGGDGRPAQ